MPDLSRLAQSLCRSVVRKQFADDSLGVPSSPKGILKLAVAVGFGAEMTSVVVGGLFNAVAFAGAGFLSSKLNHGGYEDEMKRHNRALEKLAKAKEKWYESQVEKKEQNSDTQTGTSRRQIGYGSNKPCSGLPAESAGGTNPG
ncbi:Hypothetical predicted protein [Paramuricea clavata]|uniref:Uncharacterized protein n=1 Tax=Paramuricea clavata TaxID=317549 RepID=A0A6S7FWN7_PARCT|nr:Hypothetical predicted protein [Paramuricea clavata]